MWQVLFQPSLTAYNALLFVLYDKSLVKHLPHVTQHPSSGLDKVPKIYLHQGCATNKPWLLPYRTVLFCDGTSSIGVFIDLETLPGFFTDHSINMTGF